MEKFIVFMYEGNATSRMKATIVEAENEDKAWKIAGGFQTRSNTLHLLGIKEAEVLAEMLKITIAKAKI